MANPDSGGPGPTISLHYHQQMLRDRGRLEAFAHALALAVPEGGKVVDLGGGTGVMSWFAAQRAARVWCVELLPEVARAARRILALNSGGEKVEVIETSAFDFLPPEPVDVVVCEMLHSALLRERQVAVIAAFKARYRARFGAKVPIFIPEATILAVQPVAQSFEWSGYHAPLPVFYDPRGPGHETVQLGEPVTYSMVDYRGELPERFSWQGELAISADGTLNAVRFITKNVVGLDLEGRRSVDWHNQYLVLPLAKGCEVHAGISVRISFDYLPGGSIESLVDSLRIEP